MRLQPRQKQKLIMDRKVKLFECYTKIQLAKPIYRSDLLNKQLGLDVLLGREEEKMNEKIKDAVPSCKNNSELYKRIENKFVRNLKNQINQVFLFCGLDRSARLETSIGLPTNPGFFLLVGISLLDQKYKENYQRTDVEIAFFQFREGAVFDLLNYNQVPLKPEKSSEGVSFGEMYVKVTTFYQFLKLLKVALLNNKERDFKSEDVKEKFQSTLVMKFQFKVYDKHNQLVSCQQTMLIDLQISKESLNLQARDKPKCLWDYLLIELNNLMPASKNIHYHLVEENNFLLLMQPFLTKPLRGQFTIINTLSANSDNLKDNLQFLESIRQVIDQHWEETILPKPLFSKTVNLSALKSLFSSILVCVCSRRYPSLREFQNFKGALRNDVRACKVWLSTSVKHMGRYIKQKSALKLLQTSLVSDEISLIGRCVKSDNCKDFYNAKSHLLLHRQVSIKTQKIKQDIHSHVLSMDQTRATFELFRRKSLAQAAQDENKNKSHTALPSLQDDPKFKKVGASKQQERELMLAMRLCLQQYVDNLWEIIRFTGERTMLDEVLLEQMILKQYESVEVEANEFLSQLGRISENESAFVQENNQYNSSSMSLFRGINYLSLNDTKSKKAPEKKIPRSVQNPGKRIELIGRVRLLDFLLDPAGQEQK